MKMDQQFYYCQNHGFRIGNKLSSNNRVLYIDNDLNSSYLMKRVLEADGYNVSLASTGAKGLALANRERPDLILLDIDMPGMNGYEVTRRLRQIEHTRNTPILAVSSSCDPQDKTLSTQAGCNHYIVKPIDVDCISTQIAAFL